MSNLGRRIAALERAADLDRGPHGTLEYHMPNGSDDPEAVACDKRGDPDHGPGCVFKVAMHTNDSVRLMRICGFDPAQLD